MGRWAPFSLLVSFILICICQKFIIILLNIV
jgi:hypothetical protein